MSAKRISSTRSAVLACVSAAALLGGVALSGVAATVASASENPSGTYSNLIVLQTGSTNSVTRYDANGQVGSPQPLTNGKGCWISDASAAGPILTFSGTTSGAAGQVGLNAGSIGIAEKGTNKGQACSQVNWLSAGPETLTLTLPTGVSAAAAVLDLEVQKDVVITAALNGQVARTLTLYTGQAAFPSSPTPSETQCKAGSTSSAPNSNSADNCKWTIGDGSGFNSVTLTATKTGQFSLEGGSDWAGGSGAKSGGLPANATYFFTGTPCPTTERTVYLGGGTVDLGQASYTRNLVNADNSPCLDTNVTLTEDSGDLVLTQSSGQPFQQGVVRAPWTVDVPGGKKVAPIPALNETKVNFWPKPAPGEDATAFEAAWTTMPWCPATIWSGSRPQITGLSSDANVAAGELNDKGLEDQDRRIAGDPNDNGLYQYACIYGRTTTYIGGTYKTVDNIYLIGDVVWRG